MVWIKRWASAILMMLLIFAASATPSDDLPSFGILDMMIYKGGHMLGYALLAIAFLHGLAWTRRIRRQHIILAVLLTVAYATSDELHQTLTAGRSPAARDVLIDAVGAILGLLVWLRVRNLLRRHRRSAQT